MGRCVLIVLWLCVTSGCALMPQNRDAVDVRIESARVFADGFCRVTFTVRNLSDRDIVLLQSMVGSCLDLDVQVLTEKQHNVKRLYYVAQNSTYVYTHKYKLLTVKAYESVSLYDAFDIADYDCAEELVLSVKRPFDLSSARVSCAIEAIGDVEDDSFSKGHDPYPRLNNEEISEVKKMLEGR